MDGTALFAAGGAVVLVLLVVLMYSWRSRRDRSLAPVRLGPAWSQGAAGDGDVEPADSPQREQRARDVEQRTGVDRATVELVLGAWDEYLAVLGLATMPRGHTYRIYDPYDPPVAERRPDGPVPDPVRVARDVDRRSPVTETDALTVLHALLEGASGPDASDGTAPSERDA